MSGLLDHPATLALASTLLHFLWQGALLGLTAFALFRYAGLTAGTRYVVGVITLAAMLVSPAVTFAVAFSRAAALHAATPPINAAVERDAMSRDVAPLSASTGVTPIRSLNHAVPSAGSANTRDSFVLSATTVRTILLTVWFAGVVVLSLRLLGGWIVARRLAIKAIRPVAPEIQSLATRVAGRLALDRVVRVVESSAVTVPAMIGWMKPVVLLPAAALAGLSPAQVEALIAHELAHVRRHDYLVNLIQTIVETLLFYHPAVWWISRQVRLDREHCCDDLAVGVCDRLTYVTALANLAAMSTRPRLALAATDGSLLGRVRRILGQPSDNLHGGGWLATLLIVTLAGGAIASTVVARPSSSAPTVNQDAMSLQSPAGESEEAAAATTTQESPAAEPAQSAEAAAAREQALARLLALIDEQVAAQVPQQQLKEKIALALNEQTLLEKLLKDADAASADQQRTREERELARERLLQEEAQKYEAMLEMQRQLDRERIAIEKQVRETQSRARLASLESELHAAQVALDQAKKQLAVGVVGESVVLKLETDLRTIQNQLMSAKVEHETLDAEFQLLLREAELRRETARRQAEIDRAIRETSGDRNAELEQLVRKLLELQGQLAARTDSRYALAERSGAEPVTNPNEPVRAGDLLVVEIAGEPDLPREYQVRGDGTIRLPLIGSIRVVGSTANQVREAIAKQITDRGLGKAPGVAVSLRRPRGE